MLTATQLAWLEKSRFTQFTLSSVEALVYGCSNVITSVDFAKDQFNYIALPAVTKSLMTNNDAFLDACVLVATNFPAVSNKNASSNNSTGSSSSSSSSSTVSPMTLALELLSTYGSGSVVVQELLDPAFHPEYSKSNYKLETFTKARNEIVYHPIASFGGQISTLAIPSKSDDIVTKDLNPIALSLPNRLVKWLILGNLSPQVIYIFNYIAIF